PGMVSRAMFLYLAVSIRYSIPSALHSVPTRRSSDLFFCFTMQIKGLQTALNRFGTHRAFEVLAVLVTHSAENVLFAFEVANFEVLETLPDFFHLVDFCLGAFANLPHGLFGQGFGFFTLCSFRTRFFEFGEFLFEFTRDRCDIGVELLLEEANF